jgi:hypothetical protein
MCTQRIILVGMATRRIAIAFAELRLSTCDGRTPSCEEALCNLSSVSRPPCGLFRASLASTDDYSKLRCKVKGFSAMHRWPLSGVGRILIEARRCPALIALR